VRTDYEVIEHTADAGIAATGATKAEAFAHAAEGMYSLIADPGTVRDRDATKITVEAPDDARLLERWLLELLFLTETRRLLFHRFSVQIDERTLRAVAWGEPIDEERHDLRGDIKGVTKHMTEVTEADGAYRVRVLFDM
jgi:SHS2 domain-containing protein